MYIIYIVRCNRAFDQVGQSIRIDNVFTKSLSAEMHIVEETKHFTDDES